MFLSWGGTEGSVCFVVAKEVCAVCKDKVFS